MNSTLRVRRALVRDAFLTSSSNETLVKEYLAWKQAYTATAYDRYKIWVERFQTFVNKLPEDFLHTDYVAFAHSISKGYAAKSIQLALNIVHNYLRFFAEQGRLGFPLFLARVPRAVAKSHEAVSEEEYRLAVEALRKRLPVPWRDLVVIMLLHDTGMRIGELVNLEIDEIEEDRSAVIRTEKTVGKRRVFWNADTDQVLQKYLEHRINYGPLETDKLFVAGLDRKAGPMCIRTAQRIVKAAFAKAGLERKLSAHSFRHAFIHRLAKLGVPDAVIAQLVGHSTPASISHYTKLSRPEFKEYAHRQLAAT